MSEPIKVGIVGLGRWAKVLTRAARASSSIRIVTGYSRSQEKRDAFQAEFADTGFKSAASITLFPYTTLFRSRKSVV